MYAGDDAAHGRDGFGIVIALMMKLNADVELVA